MLFRSIEGYKKAFAAHNLVFREERIVKCRKPDFACGYSLTKNIFAEKSVDAVITVNDVMALGAKRAIKELGYIVPKDVSVAGYDDVIFSSISEIPLTTVRQSLQKISEETVQILFEKV